MYAIRSYYDLDGLVERRVDASKRRYAPAVLTVTALAVRRPELGDRRAGPDRTAAGDRNNFV